MRRLNHKNYEIMKTEYLQGWKTWNVNSVLSHVLMPQGLALNLCVKEYGSGGYLRESLIGRFPEVAARTPKENVFPQYHTLDDSYTALRLVWCGLSFYVESAAEDGELILLVTPEAFQPKPALLVLESGFLWNRPGRIEKEEDTLCAVAPSGKTVIRTTGDEAEDLNLPS